MTVDDLDILDGIEYVEHHNLNSSDSAILRAYVRHAAAEGSAGARCVLIVSDLRFERAAQAEGLFVLNPEAIPAAGIANVLASL